MGTPIKKIKELASMATEIQTNTQIHYGKRGRPATGRTPTTTVGIQPHVKEWLKRNGQKPTWALNNCPEWYEGMLEARRELAALRKSHEEITREYYRILPKYAELVSFKERTVKKYVEDRTVEL